MLLIRDVEIEMKPRENITIAAVLCVGLSFGTTAKGIHHTNIQHNRQNPVARKAWFKFI